MDIYINRKVVKIAFYALSIEKDRSHQLSLKHAVGVCGFVSAVSSGRGDLDGTAQMAFRPPDPWRLFTVAVARRDRALFDILVRMGCGYRSMVGNLAFSPTMCSSLHISPCLPLCRLWVLGITLVCRNDSHLTYMAPSPSPKNFLEFQKGYYQHFILNNFPEDFH